MDVIYIVCSRTDVPFHEPIRIYIWIILLLTRIMIAMSTMTIIIIIIIIFNKIFKCGCYTVLSILWYKCSCDFLIITKLSYLLNDSIFINYYKELIHGGNHLHFLQKFWLMDILAEMFNSSNNNNYDDNTK